MYLTHISVVYNISFICLKQYFTKTKVQCSQQELKNGRNPNNFYITKYIKKPISDLLTWFEPAAISASETPETLEQLVHF